MIDARDIVSIICMFNIDKYNSAEHPTKAYSGKQAMLNEYLDDPEHYRKFVNVIPDLFDLYDAIETEFAVAITRMVVCTVESPILATKRAAPSARVNSA